MRGLLAWSMCAAVACGSDKLAAPVVDAPVVVMHDSAPAARCDPSAPFGSATNLATLNTAANEATPRLSPDELSIVFSRLNADGTWDIYAATRATATAPFGAPSVLGTVNSVYTDVWPTTTADSLAIYFNSDRNYSGMHEQVFAASRASASADFGPPALVTGTQLDDNQPFVTQSGSALYFSSSTRPETTGGADLFYAPIDSTGTVGQAQVLLGAVNTAASEQVPSLTADELTLYFCRFNGTDNDMYMATRASTSATWGAGSAIAGYANVGAEEVPSWISPDGCDLYFYDNGSNMPGAQGADDLYEIVRGM